MPYQLHCCVNGLLDDDDETTDEELDDLIDELLDETTDDEATLDLLDTDEDAIDEETRLDLLEDETITELELLDATELFELLAIEELLLTPPALSPTKTPRPLVPR